MNSHLTPAAAKAKDEKGAVPSVSLLVSGLLRPQPGPPGLGPGQGVSMCCPGLPDQSPGGGPEPASPPPASGPEGHSGLTRTALELA